MNWATPTRKWPSSTIQGKLGFFVVVVETIGDTLVKELAGYKFFPSQGVKRRFFTLLVIIIPTQNKNPSI